MFTHLVTHPSTDAYAHAPSLTRSFIWRVILKLPENHAAYAALVDKGTHSSYENLHVKYPIKSRKLLRVLQRYSHNYLSK